VPPLGVGASAATRDRRPVLVVAPGPRLDAPLLDVAQIVSTQLPRRAAGQDSGTRALLVRLLTLAIWEAGLAATGIGRRGPRRPMRTTPAQRSAARRSLCGEFDGDVSVPFGWLCEVLGIDDARLARMVRQRVP
jgi:hypothetical protein